MSLLSDAEGEERAALPKRLKQLDDILTKKGIDLAELEKASVKDVKFWQMGAKNNDGEVVVTDLAGITFAPSWDSGPEWPVIQQGPTVPVVSKVKPSKGKGWSTAVVLPDIQIGFWQGVDGELMPTHDEAAISLALAVIQDVQPSLVVLHGDNADFPEFSKYRASPVFQRTTQATIDRCTLLGTELRTAAPAAEIVWLAGNHEERLPNYILDNAKAAFGLKRGFEPEGWPVLSMPHLCRMDDSKITYLPGYPANEYWINDKLRVIHGHKVRSNGSTAHAYLDDARVSTLYGHIHRIERAERTRATRYGPRTILAASAGCLCRIDGSVPSTKGGIDLDGHPLNVVEDWQNGLFVVDFQPGDGDFSVDLIEIWNGRARWRGKDWG